MRKFSATALLAAAFLAALCPPAFGRETGQISGVVKYLHTGKPAPDITLQLMQPSGDNLLRPPLDPAFQFTATSAKNGKFRFKNVPAGPWRVCVTDAVMAAPDGAAPAELKPRGKVSGLELRVARGTEVTGGVYSDVDFSAGVPGLVVEALGAPSSQVHTAVTDAAGQYRLGALPPDYYQIVIRSDDYFLCSAIFVDDVACVNNTLRVTGEKSISGVEFQVMPTFKMTGRVMLPDGTPAEGAGVGLFREVERFSPLTLADAQGVFSLTYDRKKATLMAVKDAFLSGPVAFEGRESTATQPAKPGEITLIKAARIRGRVVGRDGRPWPDLSLYIQIPLEGAVMSKSLDLDADGHFDTGPLVGGEYKFTLYNQGHKSRVETVTVRDGETLEEVVLVYPHGFSDTEERLHESLPVSGTVTDEAGNPLPEVEVRASGNRREGVGNAVTDASGKYLLKHAMPDENAPLSLSFRTPGRMIGTLTGVRPGSAGVDMVLKPAPLVVGTVMDDETGDPVNDFSVSIWRDRSSDLFEKEAEALSTVPEQGRFEGRITPSLAVLTVTADGYLPEKRTVDFSPDADEISMAFRMKKGVRVAGVVVNAAGQPLPNVEISIMDKGSRTPLAAGHRRKSRSKTGGRFEFSGVRPGASLITATLQGHSPLRQDIRIGRDSEDLRLVMLTKGGVAGRVTEAGRPVAGAAVAVDGTGQAVTDAGGVYALADVTAGPAYVHARLGKGADDRTLSRLIQVQPDAEAAADFEFVPATSNFTGAAAPHAALFLRVMRPDGCAERFVMRADGDGFFDFGPVPPGRALLRVQGGTGDTAMLEVDLPENGSLRRDVEIRPGVTISGVVPGGDPDRHSVICVYGEITGETLTLDPLFVIDARTIAAVRVDGEGQFTLDNIPACRCTLLLQDISLRSGTSVTADCILAAHTLNIGSDPLSGITLTLK